jgi:uncharacterized membrane protein
MESVEMMALITENPDDAQEALSDLKRLEQAGWIDLAYYALIDRDPAGRVQVEEASDPVESVNPAPADGLAGGLIGHLFGLDGASGRAARSVSIRGRSGRSGNGYRNGNPKATSEPTLQPGKSALVLVVDERYAGRVREELEGRGPILHRQLQRTEKLATLRASIERMKMDVKWLEEFLRSEMEKASAATGIEREELEATIAAARAELGAQCENLHARCRVLAFELEADLRETRQLLPEADGRSREALEERIQELEHALNDCTEEMAASVLDHMDRLAAHALALEERASEAQPGVELEIEGQLHELEVRMRRHRGELTAALGSSARRARACMERLHVKAGQATPDRKRTIEEALQALNEKHSAFRAGLRQIEKEDAFLWQDFSDDIRRSWHELSDSIAYAARQLR